MSSFIFSALDCPQINLLTCFRKKACDQKVWNTDKTQSCNLIDRSTEEVSDCTDFVYIFLLNNLHVVTLLSSKTVINKSRSTVTFFYQNNSLLWIFVLATLVSDLSKDNVKSSRMRLNSTIIKSIVINLPVWSVFLLFHHLSTIKQFLL